MEEIYLYVRQLHSYWAYLVLIILGLMCLYVILRYFSSRTIDVRFRKLSFLTLMVLHLQLVFGVLLWLISPNVSLAKKMMGDGMLRLYTLEHPISMLIGISLVTIAHVKAKKRDDINLAILLLYVFGMLFVLGRIPYNNWLN